MIRLRAEGGERRRGKQLREGRRTPEMMGDLFDGCGPRQSAYSSFPKVLKHFREGCALPKGTGTGGLRSQTLVFRPASGRALPRPCAGRPAHFARVNEADVRRDPVRPGADGGSRRLFFRFAKCWFAWRIIWSGRRLHPAAYCFRRKGSGPDKSRYEYRYALPRR